MTGERERRPSSPDATAIEIRIAVDGVLPPAKGEAKSMLAAAHVHSQRVRRLLEAARPAMAGRALLATPLRLSVVVRAPEGTRLNDATNLLGGIGDVLQARRTGADVAHLGDLADVACFLDDGQISEISYRREWAGPLGYEVVLSEL